MLEKQLLSPACLSPFGYFGFHVLLVHLIAHPHSETADHEALGTDTHVDQVHRQLHVLGLVSQVVQVIPHHPHQTSQTCEGTGIIAYVKFPLML